MTRTYTANDIKSLARQAVTSPVYAQPLAVWDKWEAVNVAMSAIGERLAENPDATRFELLNVANKALQYESRQMRYARGLRQQGGVSTRALKFWQPRPGDEFADADDRLELETPRFRKAWSALTDQQRRALALLAEFGSGSKAAAELGVAKSTANLWIQQARTEFRREWEACA